MSGQPVKVLQVLPSLSLESGMARVVMSYRNHLDPARIKADFLIHRYWPHDYADKLRAAGCTIWKVTDLKARNVVTLRGELGRFYGEVASFYDIVHCHMPNAAFLHLKAAQDAGVPVRILHSHLAASSDKRLRRVRNAPLIAAGRRHMTHAVACSRAAGEYLFGNEPFFLMRNAIEARQFAFSEEARKAKRAELGIADGAKVLGCVGRLCQQKNHAFALRMMARIVSHVPDVQLVVAGGGPLESDLKALAARLGIGDNVCFLGVRDDVAQLYSAFDALLMPSLFEGLPMVGVEAQAAGLPCVFSTNVTREVACTEDCAFVGLDASADEWVLAILSALAAPRNGDACKQVAQAGFAIDYAVDDLAGFYEKALGR